MPDQEKGPYMTTIDSTRFGTIEVKPESVLEFPHGLIGLGGSRFVLVAPETDSVFVWLHSADDPSLALPVTRPWSFFPDYAVELSDSETERLGLPEGTDPDVWVTVRATERLEDFSANLKAPIVVSDGRAYQVINEAPGAPVRASLFEAPPVAEAVA
jgi:flagellar assembly factor FliW